MESNLSSFNKIEQKINGSRKISNYLIGGMLTIGGLGFILAAISSYTGKDLLPLGNPSSLLFIPQGIIMGAYGVIANLLNIYLWYLVYINFGSGSNSCDKSSKPVEIKRKGLFKDIEVKLKFDEIKSVKLDISEGLNPSLISNLTDLISSKFNLTSISLNNPFLFISTHFDDLSK